MVKGKKTDKPKSKGPLSKYKYEQEPTTANEFNEEIITYGDKKLAELVYEKKKVGLEDMKKDMLKMMDKIDRLEDAFKYLKDRVTRLDGRG